MQDILDKFDLITRDAYAWLPGYKEEKGLKIFGCLPMYVPEEIIHAAGALPVILQEGNEPITSGHSKIQSFFCGIVRSIVDLSLKGRLDFLDALVSPEIDLPINGIANVLRINMRIPSLTVYQPTTCSKEVSKAFLLKEIKRFKSGVEECTGQKISETRLKESIKIYNRNRSLLRELYDLRRVEAGLLSSIQIRSVVMASMLMLKEDHNQLLEELIIKLKTREVKSDRKFRVVLSGSLCQAPVADLLHLIEEAGAVIADDDIYTGTRYFAGDAGTEGDPYEAIAKRQLTMPVPCPTRVDEAGDWGDYLINTVKNSGAKGVIHMVVKYCQPHEMYYPYLSKRLATAGIPSLKLEIEHEVSSIASVKTRIQAFVETLK